MPIEVHEKRYGTLTELMFRLTRHVERMGHMINECAVLVRNPQVEYNLGDLGIDGRVVLKWFLDKG
jgi:hypothetical protein